MEFKEVTNLRTGRKTYFVTKGGRLVRVGEREYYALDNGGNFNSAVMCTENGRRYYCHAR